jgi:hypothetical protein
MTKVKKVTTNSSAWIVNSLDRGEKSKQNNVYHDKEEFLIELYNPLQNRF